jgi:hypothetical protein
MHSGHYIINGHRCKASCMWCFKFLALTPADDLCCVSLYILLMFVLVSGGSDQLCRLGPIEYVFYLRTEA